MKEAKARQSKKVARGSKAAQSKKPTQSKRPTQSKKAAGRPKDFGKLFHDLDAVHHFVQGGALHTDDIMILVHLGQSAQPGADTASGLASTLHISRPRTSRSLARLAAAGLVRFFKIIACCNRLRGKPKARQGNASFPTPPSVFTSCFTLLQSP